MDDSLFFHAGTIRCSIPVSSTVFVLSMVQVQESVNAISCQEPAATINLHGAVIPVYSVRNLVGQPYRPPRPTDVLIIAKRGTDDIALWVDGIDLVRDSSTFPEVSGTDSDSNFPYPGASFTSEGCLRITNIEWFLAESKKGSLAFPQTKEVSSADYEEEVEDSDEDPAILADRAKKLARPRIESPERERIEILRFRLMYHEYAIEMKYLREVVLTGEITPIPGTPPFISGICAIRGEIISLVDLRVLFALPEKGLTDLNRVIVLTNEKITFGILADAITGTGKIFQDSIIRDNSGAVSPAKRYVLGETDGGVTVLDAAAILTDPHMVVNQGGAEPQIPR